MRGLLLVVFCGVCSVNAWYQELGPLHINARHGHLPPRYYPLTKDDKHATRKAGIFVNFIKIVPQLNPLKLPNLGPYQVSLDEVNFAGALRLSDIIVKGINGLSLAGGLEMRMNPSRIDFNATLPQASVDTNFEVHATLGREPLNLYGQLSATVLNVAVTAAIGTEEKWLAGGQPVFQIVSGDVDIDLNKLQISMNLSQHSEEFRDILVDFLNNTQRYSSIVNELFLSVLSAISSELSKVTTNEIRQYLLGSARPSLNG